MDINENEAKQKVLLEKGAINVEIQPTLAISGTDQRLCKLFSRKLAFACTQSVVHGGPSFRFNLCPHQRFAKFKNTCCLAQTTKTTHELVVLFDGAIETQLKVRSELQNKTNDMDSNAILK